MQDTLVAAVEHPPPALGLRAWLTTVLRNRVRQRWRREQRRRKREAEASKPELAVPLADRDRVRERIVRAVLELAEPYRTAVLLRYLDGLKPREIAARQNLPVETVRTRVKRGLKLLRDDLRGEPEFESWSVALLALLAPAVPSRPLGGLAAATSTHPANARPVSKTEPLAAGLDHADDRESLTVATEPRLQRFGIRCRPQVDLRALQGLEPLVPVRVLRREITRGRDKPIEVVSPPTTFSTVSVFFQNKYGAPYIRHVQDHASRGSVARSPRSYEH